MMTATSTTTLVPTSTNTSSAALSPTASTVGRIIPTTTTYTAEVASDESGHADAEARVLPGC